MIIFRVNPLEMFLEEVEIEGKKIPIFKLIENLKIKNNLWKTKKVTAE